MKFTSRVLLLAVLVCWTGAARAQAVWRPDPSLAAQLGPTATLEHCAFNPPVGFTLLSTTSFASGRKLYKFEGARRDGGRAPTLFVTTETERTHTPDWTLAGGMNELLQGLGDRIYFDKITTPERGQVGDRAAVRCYAKGDYDLTPTPRGGPGMPQANMGSQRELHRVLPTHLLAYGVGDDRTGTLVVALDNEPYSANTLPVMEAAAQTVRLTDAPSGPAPSMALVTPGAPGQWQPRPDLLGYLAAESATDGVALRAPRGWTPISLSFPGSADFGFGWQERGADVPALLRVIVQSLPAGAAPPRLEDIVASLATDEGKGLEKYVHTPPEFGQTGFGPTGRFYAAGNFKVMGETFPKTLVVYGVMTRTQFVQIEAVTVNPNGLGTLKMLEAAILTGHFTPASSPGAAP